jgi:hypothetical protein
MLKTLRAKASPATFFVSEKKGPQVIVDDFASDRSSSIGGKDGRDDQPVATTDDGGHAGLGRHLGVFSTTFLMCVFTFKQMLRQPLMDLR